MQIIDGKQISKNIFNRLKTEFLGLNFKPVVYDVLVGDDPVSASYVGIKAKAAKVLGLEFRTLKLDSDISQKELENRIVLINAEQNVCGVVLQLPLPNHLDQRSALNAIQPEFDVDAMGKVCLEKFYSGQPIFIPPTVAAIWEILKSLPAEVSKKNILVIGQGELVGRPTTYFLKKQGYNVSVADSETPDISILTKEADVIISATGHANLITKDIVRVGAVVIDAGTSESSGAIVGDVSVEVGQVAGFMTPVPGGVGPVTVAMLYNNVAQVAQKLNINYGQLK